MLLELRNLTVNFPSRKGDVTAVDGLSLSIPEGSIFGLAGESGCGKTTTGLALLRMIKPPGIVTGEIEFDGKNPMSMSEEELRKFRWKEVSMIFQGAMNSLNPVKTVASQIADAIMDHSRMTRGQALQAVRELVKKVHLPADNLNKYPHQLSGGQKQRVVIAMAIALGPKLIIADEPTTALDVVSQDRILNLLREVVRESKSTVLFISHDLSVLSSMCDTIAIMYLGNVVEQGKVKDVLLSPLHPYTEALINSNITLDKRGTRVESIGGYPPVPIRLPKNCRFSDRCQFATDECRTSEPPAVRTGQEHIAYCFHPRMRNAGQ